MAAAHRALEGEFRADVQAQFRLVVNAYEPHLASLNDGEICRALLLAAPGSGAAWMRRYEGTSQNSPGGGAEQAGTTPTPMGPRGARARVPETVDRRCHGRP